MSESQNPPVWGILLAAGQGTRYQKAHPGEDKLLAPLPNAAKPSTVLAHSLLALAAQTERTAVIIHPDQKRRYQQLLQIKHSLAQQGHPLTILTDEQCLDGMGASLASVARHWLQTIKTAPYGVLVALADMPWIQPASYQAVAQALRLHAIAAPYYRQKRGHPVGFQWALLPQLATLKGDQGARTLLKNHGCHQIATADPGVLMDIDHPEDLQQQPER